MRLNIRWLLIFLVVAGIGVGVAAGWLRPAYTYHGSVLESPLPAADFTLTDQYQQPFHLRGQSGKVVLLYFGYTACVDACPAALARLQRVRAALGPQAAETQVVFVTVDPERDTAEVLRDYVANFDPTFLGLTGTWSETLTVFQSYGIYQAKVGDGAHYLVDHTDRVFVIDRKSNLRLIFSSDASAADMAQDIQHLLQSN